MSFFYYYYFLCDSMPEIWSTDIRLKWIWNNPDIILWMLKITGSSSLSESILLSLFISVDGASNRVSIKPQCSVNSLLLVGPSIREVVFMCLCALVFCQDCTAYRNAWFLYRIAFSRIKSYLWHALDWHGIIFCCFWLIFFIGFIFVYFYCTNGGVIFHFPPFP